MKALLWFGTGLGCFGYACVGLTTNFYFLIPALIGNAIQFYVLFYNPRSRLY